MSHIRANALLLSLPNTKHLPYSAKSIPTSNRQISWAEAGRSGYLINLVTHHQYVLFLASLSFFLYPGEAIHDVNTDI